MQDFCSAYIFLISLAVSIITVSNVSAEAKEALVLIPVSIVCLNCISLATQMLALGTIMGGQHTHEIVHSGRF